MTLGWPPIQISLSSFVQGSCLRTCPNRTTAVYAFDGNRRYWHAALQIQEQTEAYSLLASSSAPAVSTG